MRPGQTVQGGQVDSARGSCLPPAGQWGTRQVPSVSA